MRKLTVAGISALSIAAGSFAVAAAVPVGAVLADDTTTTTTPPASGATGPGARLAGGPLAKALEALVADGTLTKDQADKIKAKVGEAAKDAKDRVGKAPMMKGLGATLEDIATYLGTDVAGLREQLKTKSLGEIAGDKKAGLVQMLTDKANARIDDAVSKGKLDATRAATMKTKAAEEIAKLVDRVGGPKGFGPGGHRGGR